MKITVKGVSYDAISPEQAPLSLLMKLKTETGIGMVDIERMSKASKPMNGVDGVSGDQDDALIILGITIWLSMNVAGNKVSFEDATSCTMSDIDIVNEPGDPGEVVDPTVPVTPPVLPDSAADVNNAPPPAGIS